MSWDAHRSIDSPSVVNSAMEDSPSSKGLVNRHPVYFTEGNVANLGPAPSGSMSTPFATDLIPALPSFLGSALAWGLGESVAPTANDETCNGGSPSVLNGGESLPESMQRSLRAAWTKVNWKALCRLRHAHYYTGEVARIQSDLQSGSSKDKHEEGELPLNEGCDVSTGNQILLNAAADSGSIESVKRYFTTTQENTTASLTDALYKQGLASLCTRILPSTGTKNMEKGSTSNTSFRRTDGLQPHGYGVLLYIIYGYRKRLNGSTLAASTTSATGCSGANDNASAEYLIPLALVPKVYCPVLDLFGKDVLDADLVEMSGRTSKSVWEDEQLAPLQFMRKEGEHNDKVAVLSLVIYEGNFCRGRLHGKGRLSVVQRYILEGEWVHGAPQLKGVCVLRKIYAYQIDSQGNDQYGRCLDHFTNNGGKYEDYPHTSSEVENSSSRRNGIIFSEQYMGTLAVGINRRKALSPEEIARLSEPWKRQGGLSWAINPRISLLYDGLGEALSTPGGHTQPLPRSRVAFTPHGTSSDYEEGLTMERKGIVWYCGEWVAGERHGVGAEWRSTGPNRGLYLGNYEHQKCHGPGTLDHDDGNGLLLSLDRSSDSGSMFSGTWKCGVLQPAATLLLNSKPFVSLKAINWKFTPGHTAREEEFFFDQAFFMKGHHSLSCIWELIFRRFDTALGSLPPLEDCLMEHLGDCNEEATTGSFGDSRVKRLNEYIRPILEAVVSLKEWNEALTIFQRLFYFIFGKCSRSKMYDDQKNQRQQSDEVKKSALDTAHDQRLFHGAKAETMLRETGNNALGTKTLLQCLEQLGGNKPYDTYFLNTRYHGSRPTPHFIHCSPSWCQLIGLSTTTEDGDSLHQRGFDTQEVFVCARDQTESVTHEAEQFSTKMSGYADPRIFNVTCLHAHSTNPAYTSIPMMRGQTPDTTAERACHYAASFVTSIRLRLIPFLALHPIACEEIIQHKILEQFGWNVVYCLVGPLLYDLCNAVVVQQNVDFVGAYLHNGKGLDNHHLTYIARRSLAREQCFSFSSATQHDMRLGDLHAAVSRLLQETNVFQCATTKQMDSEPLIKTCGEHSSHTCLKNIESISSLCIADSVKQDSIKVNGDPIPRVTQDLDLSLDEETLIYRVACIFSNPALSLIVKCQSTSLGSLFLWHSPSQTHQEAILGSKGSHGTPLYASATLSDILDTLTVLVHLSVIRYPDEPLLQQRWLGKCVLLAACKAKEMLMQLDKQETYSSPFCEEALRQVGFSPFACVLLACLTTLGSVSPTLPLTAFSRLLLHDLTDKHHHHNALQSLCDFKRDHQTTTTEKEAEKSGSAARMTAETSLRDVFLRVLNASCRLVHCYPRLIQPVYCQNIMDKDICIYPLDELYVRAQYCISLCGSKRFLKELLGATKQQQIPSVEISNELTKRAHTVLPSYTCFNHPFPSCTVNELILSMISSPCRSSFDSPLKVSEAMGSSTDVSYELKNLLQKTLRLPKEIMMDHLEQYWSEKSTSKIPHANTGYTETEERGSDDCKHHLNLFKDQKQTMMQQDVAQVSLDCDQGTCPQTSQLKTHISNGDDAPLSDFAAWIFKCVNAVLQGSGSNLSFRSNIHAYTTTTEAVEVAQESCCENNVYVWKHFVYGFHQREQCTSTIYHTPTRGVSMSSQSLLRDGHCTGQQGQVKPVHDAENTENETLARAIFDTAPYRRSPVEVIKENTFAYPPLLLEEDFCYIALLVLFMAELGIKIELQVFFVGNDNDDEVENAETCLTPPAHVNCVQALSIPKTNCISKFESNITHERLQRDLIIPLSQSLSNDTATENQEPAFRTPSMESITEKDVYPISKAQVTTTLPSMNVLQNLAISATGIDRNSERSNSAIDHEDSFQLKPDKIQGREFTLTLSMPSAFPQSIGMEVLESAWSTVAVMLGGNAASFRRKTRK